ncbi:hypothetical protein QE152_g22273 [Popillia japonica]|uniref:Uncharacterized protein n=1 Tax=Popillia japonica TaxID=7064 RepID=A0AAW1KLM0_POPJA
MPKLIPSMMQKLLAWANLYKDTPFEDWQRQVCFSNEGTLQIMNDYESSMDSKASHIQGDLVSAQCQRNGKALRCRGNGHTPGSIPECARRKYFQAVNNEVVVSQKPKIDWEFKVGTTRLFNALNFQAVNNEVVVSQKPKIDWEFKVGTTRLFNALRIF